MSDKSSGSINIPQIAACALIGYFVFRWLFKSSDPNATASNSSSSSVNGPRTSVSSNDARRILPTNTRRMTQQVEVVRGMFPMVSADAVEAELIRNGGSIEIAAEKILSNGFLPEPLSPRPTESSPPGSRTHRAQLIPSSSSSALKSPYNDLIVRYDLRDRLNEQPLASPGSSTSTGNQKGKAPASKAGRQMAHKEKRDQMVLEARRTIEKMLIEENATSRTK